MKLIYTHENLVLVVHAQNLLEQQGLRTAIKNEFARGAVGDISALSAWPEVWVMNDDDYDTAVKIIREAVMDSSATGWVCKTCNEENEGSFEFCWNCEEDRNH
jgi:hypothetical protein